MKGRIRTHSKGHIGRGTLSFGIAAVPENGLRVEEVVKAADDVLYAAKKEGRESANATKGEDRLHAVH